MKIQNNLACLSSFDSSQKIISLGTISALILGILGMTNIIPFTNVTSEILVCTGGITLTILLIQFKNAKNHFHLPYTFPRPGEKLLLNENDDNYWAYSDLDKNLQILKPSIEKLAQINNLGKQVEVSYKISPGKNIGYFEIEIKVNDEKKIIFFPTFFNTVGILDLNNRIILQKTFLAIDQQKNNDHVSWAECIPGTSNSLAFSTVENIKMRFIKLKPRLILLAHLFGIRDPIITYQMLKKYNPEGVLTKHAHYIRITISEKNNVLVESDILFKRATNFSILSQIFTDLNY